MQLVSGRCLVTPSLFADAVQPLTDAFNQFANDHVAYGVAEPAVCPTRMTDLHFFDDVAGPDSALRVVAFEATHELEDFVRVQHQVLKLTQRPLTLLVPSGQDQWGASRRPL